MPKLNLSLKLFLAVLLLFYSLPAQTAQIFVPGVISTPDDELNAAFSPDGKTVYFTKNVGRKGVIVFSSLKNAVWSKPEVAIFSGRYSDFDPYFSADGKRLYFISNRPLAGASPKTDFDIWFVEKTNETWSTPQNLGAPVNSGTDELYPALAADETLYFSTNRDGGRGRFDLYRSKFVNGKYLEPENLGEVNSPVSEADCYVAPDQSFLIVASYGRADGFGDGDLYVSFNQNGVWTKAVNLGAGVNSTAREYAPIGSPDGKSLFFTSERGFQDIIPAKPFSFGELEKLTRSVENGKGNIYRIEIGALNLAALKKGMPV